MPGTNVLVSIPAAKLAGSPIVANLRFRNPALTLFSNAEKTLDYIWFEFMPMRDQRNSNARKADGAPTVVGEACQSLIRAPSEPGDSI